MPSYATREGARIAGLTRYFTGVACRNGHVAERYVRNHGCCECAKKDSLLRSRDLRKRSGHAAREKAYRHTRPQSILLREAKKRARLKKLPFNLTLADVVVPSTCPILGIPLRVGSGMLHDGSPSMDRIRPSLGYVRGNVAVISHKANRMKNNGSLEDFRRLVDWMERQ